MPVIGVAVETNRSSSRIASRVRHRRRRIRVERVLLSEAAASTLVGPSRIALRDESADAGSLPGREKMARPVRPQAIRHLNSSSSVSERMELSEVI